jgi:hypothetical protein
VYILLKHSDGVTEKRKDIESIRYHWMYQIPRTTAMVERRERLANQNPALEVLHPLAHDTIIPSFIPSGSAFAVRVRGRRE